MRCLCLAKLDFLVKVRSHWEHVYRRLSSLRGGTGCSGMASSSPEFSFKMRKRIMLELVSSCKYLVKVKKNK